MAGQITIFLVEYTGSKALDTIIQVLLAEDAAYDDRSSVESGPANSVGPLPSRSVACVSRGGRPSAERRRQSSQSTALP